MSNAARGATLATITALAWGGQFVVGKSALAQVDAVHLTAIRYAGAAALLLAILAAVEGRRALSLDGRGLRLLWLGTLGFAGFNLLVYTGLQHAQAQSAALIAALAPLLTALVLWLRTRVRPAATTLIALVVALTGVALVISRGHPSTLLSGSLGWPDLLVLGGVLGFVLYSLGALEFREFSALRYTALTAGLGWLSIAAATVLVTVADFEPEPSVSAVWSVAPQLVYITLLGAVVAVLFWNFAVADIGAQNTMLFGNLIPVTTFAIAIAQGYRPGVVELIGAGVTVVALVGANLFARRSHTVRTPVTPLQEQLLEAA